ncbi:MAG: zinc-ribbon domain-containing protein [Bacteroidales bacterium]|nr:zinc-ribbon domain-containing protein [Bacteroidales bacterium]
MQLKCSKCQKVNVIADDKLPKDKEKAMVKCPACQQVLVFTIPAALRKSTVQDEKTVISGGQTIHQRPILWHANDGTEYNLEKGINIIGREADISFPNDRYISRKHCVIEVIEKYGEMQCILTDDGSLSSSGEPSTNGTFLNDLRLTRYDKLFLNHGDKIRVGRTEFLFKND